MKDKKPPLAKVKRLAKVPVEKPYAVGHGKPPEATRFKPGRSGNPKGRPKGTGNRDQSGAKRNERLHAIILGEAFRMVKVNDGAVQVSVPMAQAVMRSLSVKAVKGNTRAQKLFTSLLSDTELSNKKAEHEYLEAMIAYKAHWETELERREFYSITNQPNPLPHPDDIIVDFQRNTACVRGPMDKRELADLDFWLRRRNDFEAELQFLLGHKASRVRTSEPKSIKQHLAHTRRMLELVDTALDMRASPGCIERRLSQLDLTSTELSKPEELKLRRDGIG